MPELQHLMSITLHHAGDCILLGVSGGDVYVEELYSDDDWLAQHIISSDGEIIHSVDEENGKNEEFQPLDLPSGLHTPASPRFSELLNFSGPRLRGLRETDRISEAILALTVQEKMHLMPMLGLQIPPMLLLGVAESAVLSGAALSTAAREEWLIIRRLRLAYALSAARTDADGLPYDYDTVTAHVVHITTADAVETLDLTSAQQELGGVKLQRPQSCLVWQGRLYVTEAGFEDDDDAQNSRLHVWQIRSA